MNNMKQVTRYQCQYCLKEFRTPDRHYCRKDPELKNCYTCKHWLHQFTLVDRRTGEGYYGDSCEPEYTCEKYETSWAENAFELMRESGWKLNCPDYERG